jgi:polyisoprenoid-binding protein YceI
MRGRSYLPLALALLLGARSAASPVTYLVTTADGNEVRYRVQEQLMGFDLPNEAVGHNPKVTGALALDNNGQVIASQSKFVIQAGSFTSDRDRRDGYVRGRLLESDSFPTIVFWPEKIDGLSAPLPKSGTRALILRGRLTVRDQTRPVTWKMNVTFAADQMSGSASTGFTFSDFSIPKPRVPVVLSVADSIHLEYDFKVRVADSAAAAAAL